METESSVDAGADVIDADAINADVTEADVVDADVMGIVAVGAVGEDVGAITAEAAVEQAEERLRRDLELVA